MGSFKIRRSFGVDVKVHWSFFLLLVFFGASGYARTGTLQGAALLAALVVVLFVFVVLHEYGHALVARRLGIGVRDIILMPLGGMARLETLPERPSDEVKVSAAGPPVNLVLAALFYGAAYAGFGVSPFAAANPTAEGISPGGILAYLGLINVILAVFNLLPAFPMDGGRILRGLLSLRMNRVKATEIASLVGQGFAALFFVLGILAGNIILAFIAVFIFFSARGEARMMRERHR